MKKFRSVVDREQRPRYGTPLGGHPEGESREEGPILEIIARTLRYHGQDTELKGFAYALMITQMHQERYLRNTWGRGSKRKKDYYRANVLLLESAIKVCWQFEKELKAGQPVLGETL
jgi:hypothetical protein